VSADKLHHAKGHDPCEPKQRRFKTLPSRRAVPVGKEGQTASRNRNGTGPITISNTVRNNSGEQILAKAINRVVAKAISLPSAAND
jgi:hypothetical protein